MENEVNEGNEGEGRNVSLEAIAIVPPRLEDAGLEDCALPLDSILEAFSRAQAASFSRSSEDEEDEDEDKGEAGRSPAPAPAPEVQVEEEADQGEAESDQKN